MNTGFRAAGGCHTSNAHIKHFMWSEKTSNPPPDWWRRSPHRGLSGFPHPQRRSSSSLQEITHVNCAQLRAATSDVTKSNTNWVSYPGCAGSPPGERSPSEACSLNITISNSEKQRWTNMFISGLELFLTLTWTSREPPHKSEPRSADHPTLDTH